MKKKKILIIFFIIIMIMLLFISFYVFLNKMNNKVILSINSQKIVLDMDSKENIIDLEALNSEKDLIIKKVSGTSITKIDGKIVSLINEINLGKIEISAKEKIDVEVKDFFR